MEERLNELEARVTALEQLLSTDSIPTDDEPLIAFKGDANVGDNYYTYEWIRPSSFLQEKDWEEHIFRLSALAHPVRGKLLQELLNGPVSVNEIVDKQLATSAGAAYHHLSALAAAGWVTKDTHGTWSIRSSRAIPLLTIIAATEDH